ncbi:MAG: RHS repeat-associated core domain-containing protein, partial [Planctomycetes bacterium]|nr:RHS repeat-associated core domain-containing protein [Planctomycetota bacterium]
MDSGTDKYLVKTETVGGCSSCGGGSAGLTHEYFYMQLDHGTPDPNEVVWMVVEDISDANGNGIVRKVFGLNDKGIKLREATITDPAETPEFWCRSIKLEESGQKLNRLAETRTPAAHNVSSSTIDEFLNPSHNGDYSNDTATLNSSAGLIEVFEYNTSGDPTGALVKRGRTGTAYYVSATDYYGDTNENRKHLVTATYAYPAEETSRTASSRITTEYAYTFWTGTDTVKTRTATLPTVASGENGSGSSITTVEYYDDRGRLRWVKDGLGQVTYYSYHPMNGQLAYTVQDADPTALPSSADNNSTKWVTSSDGSASSNKPTRGGGLPTAVEFVTAQEYDTQGRVELRLSEDGTDGTILERHYTVYETTRHLNFPYWDTSTNKPWLPIQVTAFDASGVVNEQYTVDPARTAQTSGNPTGLSSGTDQSHYFSWSRLQHDDVSGELLKTHAYHDIPSSGYGTKAT